VTNDTPAQRQRRHLARIGALRRWARTPPEQRSANMDAAKDALVAKWEREADPEGKLSPEERRRSAEALRRAHYIELALRRHGYKPAAERRVAGRGERDARHKGQATLQRRQCIPRGRFVVSAAKAGPKTGPAADEGHSYGSPCGAAPLYRSAGWLGTLTLPYGKKGPPLPSDASACNTRSASAGANSRQCAPDQARTDASGWLRSSISLRSAPAPLRRTYR
jgi:hypothetical protein